MSQPLTRLPTQALALTLPSRIPTQLPLICPRCAHRLPSAWTRQFATTRRRNANNTIGGMRQNTNVDSKLPKQGSVKSQMSKASKQQIGNDLGLLPQTLILPPKSELPRWSLTNFKRAKIRWLQLKTSFKNFWSLVLFMKWDVKRDALTNKPMRKPLELNQRTDIAADLHKQFHTALGEGDMKTLQDICCDGILRAARTRIENRKALRYDREPWALREYVGSFLTPWFNKWPLNSMISSLAIRVVSDRLAPMPQADSYIRQCTVRISSLQGYWLANAPGAHHQVHVDYVVIQKITSKGEDGPWKLWGLTEPNTMEEIDKMLEGKGQDTQATLAERIQEKIAGITSH